ncbi:MAG TPA: FAD synthase [Methanospirillum sp.]|uniref:adenylyltransferase/cytidyltransferase family protein n=1 Tax=Methanospirillum sp. TaxID=45200 RepID=UPI002CB596FE|nr:adenylyltransferase/cytidyltransferase family protein [Methanospirillum sp.]HOJ95462.1 FAD synthase [Methanospirillum sp.]HOL40217.1 FAD synthase [Methanospirillum sp.]HPP78347.1 FAD synthase [Methanospirillum sp.]
MIRVVATGTFDILHPGHLWYLYESAKLGDELWVIVARDANIRHKPRPVIPEEQRREMVAALKPVTHAVLGDLEDMFRPIREIKPDIITLGCNQHFHPDTLTEALQKQHIIAKVVRISAYSGSPYTSSRDIVREIVNRTQSQEKERSHPHPKTQDDAV